MMQMFCYALAFSMFYQHFNSIFIIICCIQARKALRALKGLVKIQALVRGYLVRKRVAATLHSVQAMIRAQAVARSARARRSMDKENRFHPQTPSRKHVVETCSTSILHYKMTLLSINISHIFYVNIFSLVATV